MKIKKIVNLRTFFYIFVLGLFCVYLGLKMNNSLYFSILFIIPISFLYLLFFRKKYVFFALATCFFIFLTSYSFIFIKNYKDDYFSTLDDMVVVAKVESIKKINDSFGYVTLCNAKITEQTGKVHQLNGKLSVNLSGDNEKLPFELYDMVSFSASRISGVDSLKEDNTFNSYYVSNNIKYSVKLVVDDIVSLGANPDFSERFKQYNRELLVSQFGERMGNLALTSLYADNNFVEEEIVSEFRQSGVAHIFSVSGLHISILALVINFLLEKLKVNKKIGLIVTASFLLFYCFLCKFNSPVVRSTIMTLVSLLGRIYFRKYDVLNSISLSGCILLLINPLYAFEIGFQMTFFAVLGLICFNNIFKFIKVKGVFLGKIKSSLVSSLSAQLGLLPITMRYFGSLFLWSTFANMLIIPLFTVFYIILFMINIFVLIIPACSVLYLFPKSMLYVIVYFNKLFITLPYGQIQLPYLDDFLTFVYYINMFLVSKFVVLKLPIKQLVSYLMVSFITIMLLVANYPRRSDKNLLCFMPQSTMSTIATLNKKDFYLFNPNTSNVLTLYNDIIDYKVYQMKYIIFLNIDGKLYASDLDYLSLLSPIIVVPEYYKPNIKNENSDLEFIFAKDCQKISVDNGLVVKYYYYNNIPQAMLVERNSQRILFFNGNLEHGQKLDNFLQNNLSFEIDIMRIYNQEESTLSFWDERFNVKDSYIFDDKAISTTYLL